jgi:hypothetical protein
VYELGKKIWRADPVEGWPAAAALSEARALLLTMEGRIKGVPYYEYAIELLLKAAETGKKADVVEAEKSDAPRAQGRRILK